MPSNDDVMWGIPFIQCPSCGFSIDCSGPKIQKFSKQQRESMHSENHETTARNYTASPRKTTRFDQEDQPSGQEENAFLVVSCGNMHCAQYNKIKVLRIPRLSAPSVKVDL